MVFNEKNIINIFIIINNFSFNLTGNKLYFIKNNFLISNYKELNILLNKSHKLFKRNICINYSLKQNYYHLFLQFKEENCLKEKYMVINTFPLYFLNLNDTLDTDLNIIPINVINLKKSIKRLNMITNYFQFYNLVYNIYEATDPFDKKFINELKENDILLNNSNRCYGEAGCALSHISIIKNFLLSNDKYCIILEDDCQVIKRIPQKVNFYNNIFAENKVDIFYLSKRVKS